ncbi:MAG: hypothetical protein VX935_07805 [Pseudomonadota bacterium]|nr:hypothetical protein [Pseudomonadota bacterium]
MEYSFCWANWDCWYGWFWSSATAAWVQGLATLGLLWVTYRTWKHERDSDARRRDEAAKERHDADSLNLEKIHQYMAYTLALSILLLKEAKKNGGLPAAKMKTNKLQLQRAIDELGELIKADRSRYEVTTEAFAFQLACQQLVLQFDSISVQVSQQSNDENAAYSVLVSVDNKFIETMEAQVGEMEKVIESLSAFRTMFALDRNAPFTTVRNASEERQMDKGVEDDGR